MKVYFKPLFYTFLVSLLFYTLFSQWKKSALTGKSVSRVQLLESMEKDGVPGFTSEDIESKKINLKSFFSEGKKLVIVNFWASWCGPCVEEIPSLISLVNKMQGQIEVIAVSEDTSELEVKEFLKAFPDLKSDYFHIIMDTKSKEPTPQKEESIMQKYGVEGMPESFLVNSKGKLIKKITGSINWFSKEAVEFITEEIRKQ